MDHLYPRIIRFVREQPWALMPETVAAVADILRFRASGARLTIEEIRARIGDAPAVRALRAQERFYDPDSDQFYREAYDGDGEPLGLRSESTGQTMGSRATVISIIGVYGIIWQRAAQVDDISGPGGTSIERLTARFRSALADQSVKGIVFDVDSPGGGVYGVPELAAEIRDARGQKPIYAVANSLAASAAYWLATQAEDLAVTPSGEVGSVGVYAAHEDLTGALEQQGVKMTLISAGKYKTEGNPFEPLSEEGRTFLQSRVEDYYQSFLRAVAKGRGVSPDDVRKGFGQGRVVGAKQAVKDGMADRVATLDETVRRVSNRSPKRKDTASAVPAPNPLAVARLRGFI